MKSRLEIAREFLTKDGFITIAIDHNELFDNPDRKKKTLEEIDTSCISPYVVRQLELNEQEMEFENKGEMERLSLQKSDRKTVDIKFKDIEKHLFQKAVNIKAK